MVDQEKKEILVCQENQQLYHKCQEYQAYKVILESAVTKVIKEQLAHQVRQAFQDLQVKEDLMELK
jgi:hypothetical protein